MAKNSPSEKKLIGAGEEIARVLGQMTEVEDYYQAIFDAMTDTVKNRFFAQGDAVTLTEVKAESTLEVIHHTNFIELILEISTPKEEVVRIHKTHSTTTR